MGFIDLSSMGILGRMLVLGVARWFKFLEAANVPTAICLLVQPYSVDSFTICHSIIYSIKSLSWRKNTNKLVDYHVVRSYD